MHQSVLGAVFCTTRVFVRVWEASVSYTHLDVYKRQDEAIGPRKRGVREQFAADARGIVVLPVFGPVVEVDIPSVQDGLHYVLPVEPVADGIREHRGGLAGAEQVHDVIVAVDLEAVGNCLLYTSCGIPVWMKGEGPAR